MQAFQRKYKWMMLAFILSLVHSFFPHHHGDHHYSTPVFSEYENDDPAWLLRGVFSFDLGEDHLEHYIASQTLTNSTVNLFIDFVLIDFSLKKTEKKDYPIAQVRDYLPLSGNPSTPITRGPPTTA